MATSKINSPNKYGTRVALLQTVDAVNWLAQLVVELAAQASRRVQETFEGDECMLYTSFLKNVKQLF